MTITSSGIKCDVCGDFILLAPATPFKMEGIKEQLHADPGCLMVIQKLTHDNADWDALPKGPLRSAFEKADKPNMEDSECQN